MGEETGWSGDQRSAASTDRTATFEAVYRAHYADVYRYVLLKTRGGDVDEIVSETFSRALVAWRSGRGPAGHAVPWLLTIARRLMADRFRRGRLIRWIRLVVPGTSERTPTARTAGAEPTDAVDFWLWIDALTRVLPARQREVLFLRYQRDLTDEDIGEILGLSASGVRTLVARALGGLRNHPELWR